MPETTAADIVHGFATTAFFFDYQPIFDVETQQVVCVEALLRWNHPDYGTLAPRSFLPLIHVAGLSDWLTEWTMRQATTDLAELRKLYGNRVGVAVNMSQNQLVDPDVTADIVAQVLHEVGEDPRSVWVEVMEDFSGLDVRRSASTFAKLRSVGLRIALDDFGTGASVLSSLVQMGYDSVKLDRTFVKDIVTTSPARSIVEAFIAFGRATGIQVVAEGVETPLQFETLYDMGCTRVQGFLLARPAPLSAGRQELAYTPVRSVAIAPRSTQTELEQIRRHVDQINPRPTTVESFDERRGELERLDAWAASLGADADLVRCEIGCRLTRMAMYADEPEMLAKWGFHTKHIAERIGEWGKSAEALVLVAASRSTGSEFAEVRIEALTTVLGIRLSRELTPEQETVIDNGIGATFEHLGLLDQAHRWYRQAFERHAGLASSGTAMLGINLADLELEKLEAAVRSGDDEQRIELVEIVEPILDRVADNPYSYNGVLAAFKCRLEVARGDLAAASAALAEGPPPEDYISKFTMLRAQATLHAARGDGPKQLQAATELVELLSSGPLLKHQHRRAQHMLVDAFKAVGRHHDALVLLEAVLEDQHATFSEDLSTLYDWIRLNRGLNYRFGDTELLLLER